MSFWQQRLKDFGHTGWGHPITYAYDQLERMAIIRDKLKGLGIPASSHVLDFGCGVGDFCKLLSAEGMEVWACDPYVRPQVDLPKFHYVESLEEIDHPLALVMTVTVLDHILDQELFEKKLVEFRERMSPTGRLLMIEYAVDQPNSEPNDYQAFRTVSCWQESLVRSGWSVDSIEPVPHPLRAPSPYYKTYAESLAAKLVGRTSRIPLLNRTTRTLSGMLARKYFRPADDGQIEESPLKLICCHTNGASGGER